MPRKIKIYIQAVQDIDSGFEYYQRKQKGLGNKFRKDVHYTLRKIQNYPFAASFAYSTIRYKTIERFPYIVLYEFDEKNIYILRLFSTHQDAIYLL